MTDVALRWINGQADVQVTLDDLLSDETLYTAVILSLFCDARADDGELPDGETKHRGWWADGISQINDNTGSKLWTLWREKRVPETLLRAQEYAEQALAWFKGDGVASEVKVTTSFSTLAVLIGGSETEYALVIEVDIFKPEGTKESFRFAYQWQLQSLVGV